MRKLYHYPLDAFSRQIRIYLKEKNIEHELIVEFPWDMRKKEKEDVFCCSGHAWLVRM